MKAGAKRGRELVAATGDLVLFTSSAEAASEAGGAPREIEIIREGQIADDPARTIVITRQHLDEMAANKRVLDTDPVVDREHESRIPFNTASARGWVKSLRVGPSTKDPSKMSLFGTVEWTAEGTEDVVGKRFRYISGGVLWNARHPEKGTSIGTVLNHVALTRDPRVKGMSPLTANTLAVDDAREETHMEQTLKDKLVVLFGGASDEAALLAAVQQHGPKITAAIGGKAHGFLGAQALAALGLGAESTFSDVEAKITALASRAGAADQLGARVAELEQKEVEREVQIAIDTFRVEPAEKEELLALAKAQPALFRSLLAKRSPRKPSERITTADKARGSNRAEAQTKKVEEYMTAHKGDNDGDGVTWAQALTACAKADPELFSTLAVGEEE